MQIKGIRCEKCNGQVHEVEIEPTDRRDMQHGVLVCLKCSERTNFMDVDVEIAFSGSDCYVVKSEDGNSTICPKEDLIRMVGQMMEDWVKRSGGEAPKI